MRYRLEKNIRANQIDDGPAVALSKHQKADLVYEEIASYVKRLREQGTVTDYNQVAFLFPAMKGWNGMNSRVHGFIEAFKKIGVPYYAPRAGRFLEVPEAVAVFGLFQRVFGAPPYRPRGEASQGLREFQNWMAGCRARADNICDGDPTLVAFLKERSDEVATAGSDYAALVAHCESSRIDLTAAVPSGLTQQLSPCIRTLASRAACAAKPQRESAHQIPARVWQSGLCELSDQSSDRSGLERAGSLLSSKWI